MITFNSINSSELLKGEKSLLSEHYVSEGANLLRKILKKKNISLNEVANVIQIIIFGKKQMQCSPNKGVPLYSGSEIMKIAPKPSTFLNKKYVINFPDGAICEKRWILITLSGTIGNISYVDYRFENAFVTDDAMRIVPKNIPWGFLYVLLKTNTYQKIIENLQYGSVVKHIKQYQIEELPLPILNPNFMSNISEMVEESETLRNNAYKQLSNATQYFNCLTDFKIKKNHGIIENSDLLPSMLGRYHVSRGAFVKKHISKNIKKIGLIKDIADVIQIVIFGKKAMQCSSACGYPLYSGSQISKLTPIISTYIHKKYVKSKFKYGALLEPNWILISLSGTIGYSTITGERYKNTFVTDDALRVIPKSEKNLGFLYAYIVSEAFQDILQSLQYGSVVQHINYRQIENLPYPKFSNEITERINYLAISSHNDLEKSIIIENKAIQLVEQELSKWLD